MEKLFHANDNGMFHFVTSTITLLEVLVVPFRNGRIDIVEKYKAILTQSKGIRLLEISNEVAIIAAELRARHNLKTPDAIQLATYIEYSADYFLTNDLKLKNISDVKVLTLSDLL